MIGGEAVGDRCGDKDDGRGGGDSDDGRGGGDNDDGRGIEEWELFLEYTLGCAIEALEPLLYIPKLFVWAMPISGPEKNCLSDLSVSCIAYRSYALNGMSSDFEGSKLVDLFSFLSLGTGD